MKFLLNTIKTATDLTRSGQLQEATMLIQQMLSLNAKTHTTDEQTPTVRRQNIWH